MKNIEYRTIEREDPYFVYNAREVLCTQKIK